MIINGSRNLSGLGAIRSRVSTAIADAELMAVGLSKSVEQYRAASKKIGATSELNKIVGGIEEVKRQANASTDSSDDRFFIEKLEAYRLAAISLQTAVFRANESLIAEKAAAEAKSAADKKAADEAARRAEIAARRAAEEAERAAKEAAKLAEQKAAAAEEQTKKIMMGVGFAAAAAVAFFVVAKLRRR